MNTDQALTALQTKLAECRRCPKMVAPPVFGLPVRSAVMLIGQAPGTHEQQRLRPFTWTAGKRLFEWFAAAGLPETAFRRAVYMSAVARCFPGKNPRGGDRVPDASEIANCSKWLALEFDALQPRLIIPVGKLAIGTLIVDAKLAETVGRMHRVDFKGRACDAIALPHPSGASTWIHTSPGNRLLPLALDLLAAHPEWRALIANYHSKKDSV